MYGKGLGQDMRLGGSYGYPRASLMLHACLYHAHVQL